MFEVDVFSLQTHELAATHAGVDRDRVHVAALQRDAFAREKRDDLRGEQRGLLALLGRRRRLDVRSLVGTSAKDREVFDLRPSRLTEATRDLAEHVLRGLPAQARLAPRVLVVALVVEGAALAHGSIKTLHDPAEVGGLDGDHLERSDLRLDPRAEAGAPILN